MRSSTLKLSTIFYLFLAAALVSLAIGCGTPANTNTTANVNLATNANTNANLNANASPSTIAGIAAREPDKYRATLVFSAETEGGEKTIGLPTLSANIARNGDARRVAFKLPDG